MTLPKGVHAVCFAQCSAVDTYTVQGEEAV